VTEAGGAPTDGHYRLDRRWRLVAADAIASRYLGDEESRLIGRELWDIAPGLLGSECEGHYRRAMEGEPQSFVGPSAVRPGRWLECRLTPTGEGVDAVLRDVTDRVEAERAREGTEQRFRALADAVPSFVWFGGPDGRLHFLNRRWYEYTGQTPEEALPDGWTGTLHPDDAERTGLAWETARARGDFYEIEMRYRRHDGDYRWHLARAEPVRNAAGEIVEWFGVSTDIHDRKLAEAELQRRNAQLTASVGEADALYRAWFHDTPDSLFVIRVDPDGEFVIEQTNPAHQQSTGLVDVVGKRLEDLLPPETAAKVLATYREAVARGEAISWRDEYRLENQTVFWDTRVAPVFDEGGRVVRLFGSGRDVTAQVLAEESLKQSQKMQALGQLAGGIAHDFNNLLAAIVGSLDLLDRRAELDERSRRFLDGARQAADRGARLTSQLLAFSRSQRLELKAVDVRGLLARAEDLLLRALGPGVELKMACSEADLIVRSDPTQLELAILNLAINARDAMPEGGELTVSCAARVISGDPALPTGDYAEIAVSDTGEGMTPEVAARAFEPFFTTKGVGKGTGLGLSQVFGLARQAGGAVRIESTPGEGTTVRLLLPRIEAAALDADSDERASMAGASRSARVLVVDDDPDVRRFLVDALMSLGHRVEEASNGEEGLKRLESGPDLLLVDFAMPGMNGAEVIRAALERAPDTRAVLITGYADSAQLDALPAPVLRKPFRVDELHEVVEAALARR